MATGFLTPSGTDPEDVDRRRKYAQSLLLAGTSAEPVRHPLQAVARALQGGLGGYLDYQAREEGKAEQAKAMAGLMAAIQGTPAAAGVPPTDRSVPAILPDPNNPPARISAPSAPVEPPAPHQTRGVIQGNLSDDPNLSYPGMTSPTQPGAVPVQTQSFRPPQVPQQAPTMPPASGGVPPNTGAVLSALSNPWLGKGGQAVGTAVASKLLTPKDQWVPFTMPDGTPGQRNMTSGEIKPVGDNKDLGIIEDMRRNPQKYGFTGTDDPNYLDAVRKRASGQNISTTVQNFADPVLEGVAKQVVEGRKGAVNAANTVIPSIHEARKALDQGAITGALAEGQLGLVKIGNLFGLGSDKAANTEVLRSAVGNQTLAHAKDLGANPSNADREYIANVIGGKIALEEKSIRRLLDMQEKWARQSIQRHNETARKLIEGDKTGRYRSVESVFGVDEPGQYTKPEVQPSPADIESEMRRRGLLK